MCSKEAQWHTKSRIWDGGDCVKIHIRRFESCIHSKKIEERKLLVNCHPSKSKRPTAMLVVNPAAAGFSTVAEVPVPE